MVKGDTHKKKHNKTMYIKYELEIAKKNEGEFYAKVQCILNGNRIQVKDMNDNVYQVIIRGNMYFGSKKENLRFLDPDRNDYWVLIQLGVSKNQYLLKHIYNEADRKKLYDKGELLVAISQINTIKINNNDIKNDNTNDKWVDNI